MFKKTCCMFICLIFINLLVGCKAQYLTIYYKDNSYNLVYDWEMAADDYEVITITEDDTKLNLRIYNNDINNEFIFCENTGSLYHNNKFEYPLNNDDNIISLEFLSNENKEISDRKVINDFITILSGEYENDIDVSNNLLTVVIHYKCYPAIFYCGCIVTDKQGNYWLRYDNTIYDSNKNDLICQEKFYPIPFESKLLSNAYNFE